MPQIEVTLRLLSSVTLGCIVYHSPICEIGLHLRSSTNPSAALLSIAPFGYIC